MMTKNVLEVEYIYKKRTIEDIAASQKVSKSFIWHLIIKYDLKKPKTADYTYDEILVYKNNVFFKEYKNIQEAKKEIDLKDFTYKKKFFKGEIIIKRRKNLDICSNLEQINNSLTSGLPINTYIQKINHYNSKIRRNFKQLGYTFK